MLWRNYSWQTRLIGPPEADSVLRLAEHGLVLVGRQGVAGLLSCTHVLFNMTFTQTMQKIGASSIAVGGP